ncbi:ROK family protein [Candidatus Bathyarchaeota archaeon]|nr:ROK family protein [Candidatus Bathyarchaeota archaeon]MBS7630495.1 ROK family protein [Candidatus Bathyarchaeota archaeon]
MGSKLCIGVDLGATNIRVALGDETGIKKRIVEKTDRLHGSLGISEQIVSMVRRIGVEDVCAIGIGSIGPLELSRGRIVNTPNLPFKDIPIVKPLSEEFDIPVRLLNDCCAAVLGEHVYGAGKGIKNLVYITFSTGLGGGAMVDGHLLQGKDGNAHEIGHLTIDANSELLCGCGCRGHWEAYCSGANIPNYARWLIQSDEAREKFKQTIENPPSSTEEIFSKANEGDLLSSWIVEKIGEVNAVGFADVINVYDPELITVGGSIAIENPDLILKPILSQVSRHVINRLPKIRITLLLRDTVLYGALALAMQGD